MHLLLVLATGVQKFEKRSWVLDTLLRETSKLWPHRHHQQLLMIVGKIIV